MNTFLLRASAMLLAAACAMACARGASSVPGERRGPLLLSGDEPSPAALAAVEAHASGAPVADAQAAPAEALRASGVIVLRSLDGVDGAAVEAAWRAGAMVSARGEGASQVGVALPLDAGWREILAGDAGELAPGLALLGDTVVAADVLEGDRLIALLDALARHGKARRAIGLTRGASARLDLERGWLQVLDGGPVLVLDAREASLNARRKTFEDVRLHWLDAGDQFGWDSGLMQFVARKIRVEGGPARADATLPDAFVPDALPTLVRRVASTERGRAFTAQAGTHVLSLSSDTRTVAFRSIDPEGSSETMTDAQLIEQRTYSLWSALLSLKPVDAK